MVTVARETNGETSPEMESAGCVVTCLSACEGPQCSHWLWAEWDVTGEFTDCCWFSKSDDEGKIEKSLVIVDNMAVQCDPHSYSRPPNWLERTFLYTFGGYWPIRGLASNYWPIRNLHSYYWPMTGLSGLVILLHTSSLYMSSSGSQQFIILAPPRYYYYPTKLVMVTLQCPW